MALLRDKDLQTQKEDNKFRFWLFKPEDRSQ